MDDLLREIETLYQAAKDRRKSAIGIGPEAYYKGQVAAYGRAVTLIRNHASQQPDPADPKQRCTCRIVVPKDSVGTIDREGCPVHPGG